MVTALALTATFVWLAFGTAVCIGVGREAERVKHEGRHRR